MALKNFNKGGEKNYNVVAVNKQGEVESYVSSVHIKSNNNLKNKIKNGAKLLLSSKRKSNYGDFTPSNSAPNGTKVGKNFGTQNKNSIQKLHTPKGVVYGAKLPDGTIYINPDNLNYNTLIHEYSHIWEQLFPQEWQEGLAIFKQTEEGKRIYEQLKSEGNYGNLSDEKLWSEAMNTAIGNIGEKRLLRNGSAMFRDWVKAFFVKIGKKLGLKKELTPHESFKNFANSVINEMVTGKKREVAKNNNQVFGENNNLISVERNLKKNLTYVLAHFGVKKECG